MQTAPALNQILARAAPVREMELETRFAQTARDDPAALQDQLGFRSDEDGANFEHPLGSGHADVACTPGGPQRTHEFAIRHGARRSDVHRAIEIFTIDKEFDRTNKIHVVNHETY